MDSKDIQEMESNAWCERVYIESISWKNSIVNNSVSEEIEIEKKIKK